MRPTGARTPPASTWCGSAAPRTPTSPAIVELRPDLVVANAEENRAADLEALRAGGLAVWVTDLETVPTAFSPLRELLGALGDRASWLDDGRAGLVAAGTGAGVRAVVPIWRRPWMALGRDTFAGDLLARLGVDNVLAGARRTATPGSTCGVCRAHDLVVLPDEPYAFSAADGPEAFAPAVALVSGRHLTWYGPSLAEARACCRLSWVGDAAPHGGVQAAGAGNAVTG